MSGVEEKEKPVILVSDYRRFSRSILNNQIGVRKSLKEADDIAATIDSIDQEVVRTNDIWPRNSFYSESGKLIVKYNKDGVFPLVDEVLGDSGLFLSSETTMLVSDCAVDTSDNPLEKRAENFGIEKQIIKFNVSPRPLGWALYPGLNTENRSLTDIDYVANWIFDEGVLFTYDFLLKSNERNMNQLNQVGVDKIILLPEEEFKYFAVNFGVFETENNYQLVVNSRCTKTIDLLKAEGFNVISTDKPLDSLSYSRYGKLNKHRGGGVRCSTNELYPSSLEGLKDEALMILGVYNKL